MAVVNVMAGWSRNEGGVRKFGGAPSENDAVTYWTVLCNDFNDDDSIAYNAAGLPEIGDLHPQGGGKYAIAKRIDERMGLLFRIRIEYAGQASPLIQPYERSWACEKVVEKLWTDASGNALLNPLGERYEDVSREFTDVVYTVTRNEASFPQALIATHVDHVNSDAVTFGTQVHAVGTCLMHEISGQKDQTGNYYRVTYRIRIRSDGWKKRILCEGYVYWNGAYNPDGSKFTITADDSATSKTGGTVLLTATGLKLPNGAAPVWLLFTVYPSANFSNLALG